MSTTTTPNPTQARGILHSILPGTPARITLAVPGTNYQIHLGVDKPPQTPVGKRLVGNIKAQARRIDIMKAGGRFVEPVAGRPRRIQGSIIEIDASGNSICVDAGVPIWLKIGELQRVDQFKVGDFIATDALPGATFTS